MKKNIDQIVVVISTLVVIVIMMLAIYFFQIKVEDNKSNFLNVVNEEIKIINNMLKKPLTIKNVVKETNQTSYIYIEPSNNNVRIVGESEKIITNDINSVMSEIFDYLDIINGGVNFELLYSEFSRVTKNEFFTNVKTIDLNRNTDAYSFFLNNVNMTNFYDELDDTLILRKRPFKLEIVLENDVLKSINLLLEGKEVKFSKINEFQNEIIIHEDTKVITVNQFIS